MKKRQLFFIPIFAIILIGVFVVGFSINNHPSNSLGESIGYNSMVCTETTGDFEGRQTPLGEYELVGCNNNVLYDTGAEAIEGYLGGGTGDNDAFDWIDLGNASKDSGTPIADSSESYTAHSGCGLNGVAGTQGTNAASGNWTVYNEFTSTCADVQVNVSHLNNSAGVELAGNTFTLVTLESGDKLNVTWDVWVV